MRNLNIIIGGDLVPTRVNQKLFASSDMDQIIDGQIKKLLESSDMRVFNLEVPLTNTETPISKCGPNLIAPTNSIKGIKELNPSMLSLANNHILDQGDQGLQSTIDLLQEHQIQFVGAGKNISEASKPIHVDFGNIKVGFYACAEIEFSIATEETAGANPFDIFESLSTITELKKVCDYVIVLYHGGKEHYRYPSPYLQKVTKKMVDKGADLVICQHSHCIGSYEKHEKGTIVYGQGNFIFNEHDNEFWNTSLLLKVILEDSLSIEYIPIIKTDLGIRHANSDETNKILKDYHERSSQILQDGFIADKYTAYAEDYIEGYLRHFVKMGKWISKFDRRIFKGRILKSKCDKAYLLKSLNFIECEAHRELMIEGLKNRINKIDARSHKN